MGTASDARKKALEENQKTTATAPVVPSKAPTAEEQEAIVSAFEYEQRSKGNQPYLPPQTKTSPVDNDAASH